MSKKKLLTEIERQQKYLNELPAEFTFPLFNSRKALESQRKSGYRNSAAAGREIIDNAIEAQATKVQVVFESPRQQKKSVSAVAFIDDGSGMLPKMLQYALSWGGGTHFDDHEFIGKFGFGLPNASINQTRRLEVYSRTSAKEPLYMSYLDIDEYTGEGNLQNIRPATVATLPEFVESYLSRNDQKFEHGTIVVWVKPDHLTYRTTAKLKEHLLDDFGVTYRYLLKDFRLVVDGVNVEPVDHLFLDPKARLYLPPEQGGAASQLDETMQVMLVDDPATGERRVEKVEKPSDLDSPHLAAVGSIHLRVSRLPPGFAVGTETEGIDPVDQHAKARFGIRKTRRGMTFVRAGREIETIDAFPRREQDKSAGLGDWPLLQSYAYHWGIEVKFSPSLDDIFGIGNDKQTVRPVEGFWRLLASEGVDDVLHREQEWQRSQRRTEVKAARVAAKLKATGEPTMAEFAASRADAAMGQSPSVPENDRERANLNLEEKVAAEAPKSQKSVDEVREQLQSQIKKRPYLVEYQDDPHGPIYTPSWRGSQVVVTINRAHVFFTTLYDSLLAVRGGTAAKEAVDVLLITLARAELKTKHAEMRQFYLEQRTNEWSPFVAAALRALERTLPESEDEDDVEDPQAA